MKIILISNIKKLGVIGDVVEVKDGFARNYLIPERLALAASKDNYKKIEEYKKKEKKLSEAKKQAAQKRKEEIEKLSITITAEAKEDDELYGAINEGQISKAMNSEGLDIDKDQLTLEQPIKKIGAYYVSVTLHPEVQASLRVWVVKK